MSADFKKSVDRFLRKISGPSPENLFNPWRDRDPQLDLNGTAHQVPEGLVLVS